MGKLRFPSDEGDKSGPYSKEELRSFLFQTLSLCDQGMAELEQYLKAHVGEPITVEFAKEFADTLHDIRSNHEHAMRLLQRVNEGDC